MGIVATSGPALAAPSCILPGGGAGGTLTGVINRYHPGVGTAAAGATSISVGAGTGSATAIASGDLLLVIQMQDADINSTNTTSYGDGVASSPSNGVTALNASGRYEFVEATSAVVAGAVQVKGVGAGDGLLNTYRTAAATATAGQRTFQVIRVPSYTTATTSSGLTALAWNGSVGGVLAFDVAQTLTLSGTVSVDGLGFRGAPGINRTGGAGMANTDQVVSATAGAGGNKAEGIAGTPLGTTAGNGYPGGDADRGAPGNAGGGGTDGRPSNNDQNTGGGGGGNGGAGGVGGNSWSSNLPRGGWGGDTVPAAADRLFLGGGGGGASMNNGAAPRGGGAAGGGMVFARVGSVSGTGTISANGADAYQLTANDGGGGGGAGGTILLTSASGSLTGATLRANGGRGGNAWATQAGAGSAHGPGGGGGGGWILTSSAPTATSVTGGANGITTTGNLVYGSAPGSAGQTATITDASIPGYAGSARCADLSLVKTGPATVGAGGAIAYTLAVSNAGPSTATSVSVADTLPAGVSFVSASGTGWTCGQAAGVVTCTRGALPTGTAPDITVNVTAPAAAGSLTNSATVSSATTDPNLANNTGQLTTTVTAVADLSLVKTGPATVAAGGAIAYTLAVNNGGPSTATSVSVADTLPAGVAFVSASGTGWTCGEAAGVVTCTRPSLATGAAPDITINVTAPAAAGSLVNNATVSSATTDPNLTNNTGQLTTTVTALADLSLVKTGPATVGAGGAVAYTLTVSNAGPSTATSVSVSDTLPPGVSFVSASGTGWTCGQAAGVVTCTRPSLATGVAPNITINVTAPAAAGSLVNTATVSSATTDPDLTNNTGQLTTGVTAVADLSLVKTGPATVAASGSIAYTLAVTNGGPSTATSVSVTDTLPAGVSFVSASGTGWTCGQAAGVVTCTRASLTMGAAPNITINVTAPAAAGSLVNTATVSSAVTDPNLTNNTDQLTTTVTAVADLSLVKTGPATVAANGAIAYTLAVNNGGPSTATSVSVADSLPAGVSFVSASGTGWTCGQAAGVVTCTRPSLTTGAAPNITINATAPAAAGSLVNNATVSSATTDPNLTNNTDQLTTTVTAVADLSLVKTGPATVAAGGAIAYTLAVTNGGPSTATSVSVADALPAGVAFVSASGTGWTCGEAAGVVTCTRPSLATGAAPDITINVTAPAAAGSLVNNATVSSATTDPNLANNTDQLTTTVTALADLSLTKTGPATVAAGGAVAYTLAVTNGGPSTATSVSVADTLPAGVSFVSASGTGWTCGEAAGVVTCTRASLTTGAAPDITINVTAPAGPGPLVNTATASSATTDPDLTNNTDQLTTTVTALADLSLTKTGPATVGAGGAVAYSLAVSNAGPSTATSVSVADTLPAGVSFVSASGTGWTCGQAAGVVTCTRASLAVGSAPAITVNVTAPADAGSLVNTATVSAATTDPNLTNNTDQVTTGVTAVTDLSLVKTGPATVAAGGAIAYTLAVTNGGPSTATSVSVADTLPAGVAFVSASGTGWTCGEAAGVVTCTRPSLTTGAAPDITINVTAPATGSLVNTATVSSATTDPDLTNNTDQLTTTVTAVADLSLVKTGPATVAATGAIAYTLAVSNGGPSTATSVSVADTLPAGVAFVSASGTGWTCGEAGGVVTCTRASLTTGAAPNITINVTAPAAAGSLVNNATVSAATVDPDLTNNTDQLTTTVTAVADLSLVKTGPATVAAGGPVAYTLAVSNGGPSTATSVSVADTLPAGVAFVSASGTGWTCGQAAGVVTCTRPSLATGAAPDITINVTAPAAAGSLVNNATVSSATTDPDLTNNTDQLTTTVTALADLSLVKTGPATVAVGGSIAYTLAVTNGGPSTATSVSVADTLPVGVSFVSASGTGWTCGQAAGIVTCTRASLTTGAAPDITINVTAPAAAGSLVNNATVSSATTDPDLTNNTDQLTTTVTALADLSITKTGPATVAAGGTIAYQLAVSNAGPSAATTVSVSDTLPAGVAFVSASGTGWTCGEAAGIVTCTRGSIGAGNTAPSITVNVTAPAGPGSLVNTATVSSATTDPDLTNNTDQVTTTVTALADLSITKTGPATVAAGGAVAYTLAVTNGGPSTATSVSVTDTLPAGVAFVSASGTGWTCGEAAGVVTCTRPSLATGAAPDITINVTAPAAAGSLVNNATVSSATTDPNLSNNTDQLTTTVTALADLSITKTGPATVAAGGAIAYSLAVSNAGPSSAATVSVADTLPAGVGFVSASGTGWTCGEAAGVVTCTRGSIGAGNTAPVITVNVTAPAAAGSLVNNATVSAATTDPDLTDNSDQLTTTVTALADLSITKTGPATVAAGGAIAYQLAVSNAGPSTATTVSLSDTLPAGVGFVSASGTGWTCGEAAGVVTCTRPSLATGSAPTITVNVTAPATAGSLVNTATVSAATADPDLTNNTDQLTTTVTAVADLSIAKTGPASVTAGSTVAYSLAVSNAGPSTATSVSVTDTLPAGVSFVSASGTGWTCGQAAGVVTCTQPSLATGSAPTITVNVTAPAAAGSLVNTASVSAATADPDLTNNTDQLTTTVTALADLSITKTGPPTVGAGGAVSYSLAVSNGGPSTATSVSVTDTLPADVSFVSASGTGWTCSEAAGVVTCTRASLATGAAPVLTINVTAPAGAGSLVNTASVSAATADPDLTNNTDQSTTGVTAVADLSVSKTGPASVTATGAVAYSIDVSNGGPSTATSVSVSDTLPAGVSFVSASGTGWTCGQAAGVVTCTRPSLATGAAPALTINVTAPAAAGSLVNTATVSAATADPDLTNNTDQTTTTVTAVADLSITKTGPASVSAGSTVAYSLAVSNGGPSTATSVSVTDTLPAGAAFVSASGTGWTCGQAAGVVTCTQPSLATGSAPTITVNVTAPAAAGSLVNTASVSAATADPDLTNNTDQLTTTVTALADLSITKTGPASVGASGAISYQLSVSNGGPSDASAVSVSDTLPAGVTFGSASGTGWTCGEAAGVVTCTRPSIGAGNTAPTITVAVTAPAGPGSLVNTATVSAATADPDLGNNTDQLTTAVTPLADLSLVKTGTASVAAGGDITYSLAVSNSGPSTATSVSVADALPAGVSFVSATGSGWTCGEAAGVVTCTRPSVTSGSTAPTITIQVTAPVGKAKAVNTATVSASTTDPDPSNNTDQATTTVGAAADLQLVKAGPKTAVAGGLLAYTLTVTNNGPDAAKSVVVTDPIPAGTSFVSASGLGWACSFSAGVVTCTRASIASGSTAPVIALVLRAPTSGDGVANQAMVDSDALDPVPGNNFFGSETVLVPSGPGAQGGPDIPHTGADGFAALAGGLLMLLVGLVLVRLGRRRSTLG